MIKDQWEFQMQTRTLEWVGQENLYFVSDGLSTAELDKLSVHGISTQNKSTQQVVQLLLDGFLQEGKSLAVIPEDPYCTPINEILDENQLEGFGLILSGIGAGKEW